MTENTSETGHKWPCTGFYVTSSTKDRTEHCTCREDVMSEDFEIPELRQKQASDHPAVKTLKDLHNETRSALVTDIEHYEKLIREARSYRVLIEAAQAEVEYWSRQIDALPKDDSPNPTS